MAKSDLFNDYYINLMPIISKTACPTKKGHVLSKSPRVKWVLNEDYSFYSNLVGTLLSQNFVLDNSYFIHFFGRTNDC